MFETQYPIHLWALLKLFELNFGDDLNPESCKEDLAVPNLEFSQSNSMNWKMKSEIQNMEFGQFGVLFGIVC